MHLTWKMRMTKGVYTFLGGMIFWIPVQIKNLKEDQ